MPEFEDDAPPAPGPEPAGAGSLEASFLKSVFAEISGLPDRQGDGGGRAATARRIARARLAGRK